MKILGISCDYHDSAAALIVDGTVVAAAEEERFTRVKHDSSLPAHAVSSCLAIGELGPDDLDAIVLHEKPLAVLDRVIHARQRRGPMAVPALGRELTMLLSENVLVGYRIERLMHRLGGHRDPTIRFSEHHLSHAASAFLPSPFETAAIMTIDGVGEWATASIGRGDGHRVDLLEEQRYPNSLGLLYSLATVWCGFEANEGEYKVMGLAPYGEPRFADALAEVVELRADGSIEVDVKAVGWWSRKPARLRRLAGLLDGPPCRPGQAPGPREADLARSIQDLVETAVLRMAEHAHKVTGARNVCLAGGVALNCVANGRILREGPFESIWVQPAAGDAGSAVGAALWYWHTELGHERPPLPASSDAGAAPDRMRGAALGPRCDPDAVAAWLDDDGVGHQRLTDLQDRCDTVARRMAEGAIVGWFEGPMEFGPRALGHRSILADPRSPTVQRDLNLRVKGRESFRPFAPAVLWDQASDWFDLDAPSPYMLVTHQVTEARRIPVDREPTDLIERVQVPRSQIPACTHIDGSARVQTVHPETNATFHQLIAAFHATTGCPVVLNTSFNRAGEPIVATPEQALATARAAGLDLLVIEDCVIDLARPDTTR